LNFEKNFFVVARSAFNSKGSLVFNLRYFEQVFADDLKAYLENGSSSSSAIVRKILNFYHMIACLKGLNRNIFFNIKMSLVSYSHTIQFIHPCN
jgi:hypothetical protein